MVGTEAAFRWSGSTPGRGATTSATVRSASLPKLSVTVISTSERPAVVGVPETTPVRASRSRPEGRPRADHVSGPVPPDAPSAKV